VVELAWIAAFATALCFGVSAIFEDHAAKQPQLGNEPGRSSLLLVVTRVPYLLGMVLSLVGWGLSLLALQRLPLFAVQAIAASSIGVVVIIHRVLSGEPVPRRQLILLLALGVGLVLLAVSAKPGEPGPVSTTFDIGIWIGVAVVAALGLAATRLAGDQASSVLGAISGLAYGGTALCARALETDHTLRSLLVNSLTFALVPFAILGVSTFAAALQRGSVTVAAATQHAAMTVVPSAIGLLFLGDHARAGLAVVAWIGFIVTVGSVLLLTMVRPPASETSTDSNESSAQVAQSPS
jgi:drug/metabolite transporter (DMT)-like permease